NGLVNNAGAAFATKALSADGYERTIAINHVALAALTDGLLDLLRKGADVFAAPSRVVNMTALIESRGKPVAGWSYPGKYKQIQAYADAKLLALMYTYAQARRREGEGLTFNAVSPGAVKTSLGSKAGGQAELRRPGRLPPAPPARQRSRLHQEAARNGDVITVDIEGGCPAGGLPCLPPEATDGADCVDEAEATWAPPSRHSSRES
ncbi:MAG TPA: SDR family oxidoreductase, partial [Trebonia sp.]